MMCEPPRRQTGGKRSIKTTGNWRQAQCPLDLHTFTSFGCAGFPLNINCFFCHWGTQWWCLWPLMSKPSSSGCCLWGMEKTQAAKRDTSTTLDILETKTGTGGISCEPGFIPETRICVRSNHSQKLLMKSWSVCDTQSDKVAGKFRFCFGAHGAIWQNRSKATLATFEDERK